jgi:hypothetical protein
MSMAVHWPHTIAHWLFAISIVAYAFAYIVVSPFDSGRSAFTPSGIYLSWNFAWQMARRLRTIRAFDDIMAAFLAVVPRAGWRLVIIPLSTVLWPRMPSSPFYLLGGVLANVGYYAVTGLLLLCCHQIGWIRRT